MFDQTHNLSFEFKKITVDQILSQDPVLLFLLPLVLAYIFAFEVRERNP